MATVFSHMHFCPICNDLWRCVCWVCEDEGDDLRCISCRDKNRVESPTDEPDTPWV